MDEMKRGDTAGCAGEGGKCSSGLLCDFANLVEEFVDIALRAIF